MGEFVGQIKVENGKYLLKTTQKFAKGDSFKILRDGKEVGGADFVSSRADGAVVASQMMLRTGDKVFVTTDTAVNSRLLARSRKIPIEISARFMAGERPKIFINGKVFEGEKPLDCAKNSPVSIEQIKNCLLKTDKYPFEVTFGDIETDGVFVTSAELNAARRNAYSNYFECISSAGERNLQYLPYKSEFKTSKNDKMAAICTSLDIQNCDILIYKPRDYGAQIDINFPHSGEIFLYLPPFMTDAEAEKIKPLLGGFDGIYCDGIWAIKFARDTGKKLFAGCGFNLSNSISICGCEAEYIALSKELTAKEAAALSQNNSFVLSAGAIKVMDLIYCPFEKRCRECDEREFYTLTDEGGRQFPLSRYEAGACRFELFNCANLIGSSPAGALIDCTLDKSPSRLLQIANDEEELKKYFKKYTRGHLNAPVL